DGATTASADAGAGSAPAPAALSGGPRRTPVAARGTRRTPPNRVVIVIRLPRGLLPSVTLLDRYIGQTYLRVFAVAFVGMLALFYIGLFTDYSEYLFKNQVSGSTMMRFFAYSRSEEHTSELYHVKISYAVFCLKKK